MAVAVRSIVMAIEGFARPNLGNKLLSIPTDSVVDVPACLACLGLEPDEPSPWRKVYERLLNWAIV